MVLLRATCMEGRQCTAVRVSLALLDEVDILDG